MQESKYLFRLYMSLKNYREAGNVAVIVANQEQEAGKFKVKSFSIFDVDVVQVHTAALTTFCLICAKVWIIKWLVIFADMAYFRAAAGRDQGSERNGTEPDAAPLVPPHQNPS